MTPRVVTSWLNACQHKWKQVLLFVDAYIVLLVVFVTLRPCNWWPFNICFCDQTLVPSFLDIIVHWHTPIDTLTVTVYWKIECSRAYFHLDGNLKVILLELEVPQIHLSLRSQFNICKRLPDKGHFEAPHSKVLYAIVTLPISQSLIHGAPSCRGPLSPAASGRLTRALLSLNQLIASPTVELRSIGPDQKWKKFASKILQLVEVCFDMIIQQIKFL